MSVRRMWQSAVLWRAACFVLMGSVVVLSYFALLVHQRNNDLVDWAMGLGAQEELRERMGDEAYANIFLPTNYKIAMDGVGAHDDLAGVIIVHEASHEAYLIVFGQLDNRARLEMADGTTHEFTTSSEIAAVNLGLLSQAVLDSLATASFAVIDTVTNETILRQA